MKIVCTIIKIVFLMNISFLYSQSDKPEQCDCVPSKIKTKECFDYCKALKVLEKPTRDLKKEMDEIYTDEFPEAEAAEHNSRRTIQKLKRYYDSDKPLPDPVELKPSEEKALERLLKERVQDGL